MSGISSAFRPSQVAHSNRLLLKPYSAAPAFKLCFAPKAVRPSSTVFLEAKPTDPIADEKESNRTKNILACPVCFDLILDRGSWLISVCYSNHTLQRDSAPRSILVNKTCKKNHSGKETHVELIEASGAKKYGDAILMATELFSTYCSDLIATASSEFVAVLQHNYGYLALHFELIKDYLKPVLGGNIVDTSYDSGLFSRLFAKSGLFSLVVALDYSESMLQQCYEFIKQEESFPKENLILVRADISRLPFVSSSVDAVHAGAAIHCWSSPSTANVAQVSGVQFFLHERELEDICTACALVRFTCTRNSQFVMFSATKPI